MIRAVSGLDHASLRHVVLAQRVEKGLMGHFPATHHNGGRAFVARRAVRRSILRHILGHVPGRMIVLEHEPGSVNTGENQIVVFPAHENPACWKIQHQPRLRGKSRENRFTSCRRQMQYMCCRHDSALW